MNKGKHTENVRLAIADGLRRMPQRLKRIGDRAARITDGRTSRTLTVRNVNGESNDESNVRNRNVSGESSDDENDE